MYFFCWHKQQRGDKRGQDGSEGEKERSYPGEKKLRGRSCERLTPAQLRSYISISEGIVEESAGEQRVWISTDWQNQGLMLSGEGKKCPSPSAPLDQNCG